MVDSKALAEAGGEQRAAQAVLELDPRARSVASDSAAITSAARIRSLPGGACSGMPRQYSRP
jgi:hypothetical protein